MANEGKADDNDKALISESSSNNNNTDAQVKSESSSSNNKDIKESLSLAGPAPQTDHETVKSFTLSSKTTTNSMAQKEERKALAIIGSTSVPERQSNEAIHHDLDQLPPSHDHQQSENDQRENNFDTEIMQVPIDAFRVTTRKERLQEMIDQAPLVEARIAPEKSKSSSATDSTKRLVWAGLTLLALSILAVVIVVPSVVLTRKSLSSSQQGLDGANSSPPVRPLSPSTFPSLSLVPSSSPSESITPTSVAFQSAVQLLGLEMIDVPTNPDNYIFKTIEWLVNQDEIFSSFLFLRSTTNTQKRAVQRFAVTSFYFATNGPLWSDSLNFLNTTANECEWQRIDDSGIGYKLNDGRFLNGVLCVDGEIIVLVMSGNNIGGFLPSTMGLMSNLQWIDLKTNNIGGTFPPSLFGLSNLRRLLLGRNEIGGSFPFSLDPRFKKIRILDLNDNKLTGTIPSSLETLEVLGRLRLDANFLTGSIPESIGDLTNLETLALNINLITGSIPSSIQYMTDLKVLHAPFNLLTSTLPTELNKLDELTSYWISFNLLTGPLPFEPDSNPAMEGFAVNNNQLTGDILSAVQFTKLSSLSLQQNRFTGSIPTEICNQDLTLVDLGFNNLTGTIPDCVGTMPLLGFFIANNSLVGTIPQLPPSLTLLDGPFNSFTGELPSGPLPDIKFVSLFGNKFTGSTIPTELGLMTSLTAFAVNECELSGTLPSEVGLLSNLAVLGLHTNNLQGTVPTTFGRLTNLEQLALEFNNLTGSVEFVCENRDARFEIFHADCLEEIKNCSCCTLCCDPEDDCVFLLPEGI